MFLLAERCGSLATSPTGRGVQCGRWFAVLHFDFFKLVSLKKIPNLHAPHEIRHGRTNFIVIRKIISLIDMLCVSGRTSSQTAIQSPGLKMIECRFGLADAGSMQPVTTPPINNEVTHQKTVQEMLPKTKLGYSPIPRNHVISFHAATRIMNTTIPASVAPMNLIIIFI